MVGSSIGANKVELGKRIYQVTFMISYSLCMLVSLAVFVFKSQIASLFTRDEDVKALLNIAIPLVCLDYFGDCAQGILSGTVKALGK